MSSHKFGKVHIKPFGFGLKNTLTDSDTGFHTLEMQNCAY